MTSPLTDIAIKMIEVKRHEARDDKALERDLSVNEWINRIRAACNTAHGLARHGDGMEEANVWADIAAIATARAEICLEAAGVKPEEADRQ